MVSPTRYLNAFASSDERCTPLGRSAGRRFDCRFASILSSFDTKYAESKCTVGSVKRNSIQSFESTGK